MSDSTPGFLERLKSMTLEDFGWAGIFFIVIISFLGLVLSGVAALFI